LPQPNDEPSRALSFYPSIIPAHPLHPRHGDFNIVTFADGRGRGLITRTAFGAGDIVAQLAGLVTREASLDTLQMSPGLYMADQWFSRFLLHHCEPNCSLDTGSMCLGALRTIEAGDLLTIDYAATEDRLGHQFECQCGAQSCRIWIKGRTEQPTAEGRTVLRSRLMTR
jgi:hypothetical protein